MGRRRQTRPPSKLRPYKPLLTFTLLGMALFIGTRVVLSMVCDMNMHFTKQATCTFELPWNAAYLPWAFILVGVIGTAWNFWRLSRDPFRG